MIKSTHCYTYGDNDHPEAFQIQRKTFNRTGFVVPVCPGCEGGMVMLPLTDYFCPRCGINEFDIQEGAKV